MPDMALEQPPTRISELADQCVQCGLCLPACPTYALDRSESESPRGRIAIAAALARGAAEPTAELRAHLDHCLGCLSCQRACPAEVRYDELLIGTRALLGPAPQRPRLLLGLLGLLQRPRLLRALRRIGAALGATRWSRALARHLPPYSPWRTALGLLPATSPLPLPRGDAAGAELALFPGCVASVEDAEAQQAALTLLRAAGYRIHVLPAFCCGAMDLHGGETAGAEQAARRVRQAWEASGATRLLSVTSGCLGTLRQALPNVPVLDPLTLLAERAERLRFRPLPLRVAVHLPCTQANVARSETAMLKLLHRVPQLEVASLPRPPSCCGAAGSHLLEFPERAAQLREAALQPLAALAPARLLSSNIGCRLHLAAGDDAKHWTTQHPLSLLAQQLEDRP
ncbi:(Fe-S)-binding protein [Rhodanobacter sp. DHG33]|nr:(Fe-S)-binding protein [Rhodanobacter sp. DHG33]